MEQTYMLPILYRQYHVCWCPGDLMSQGISRHDIYQISQNFPFLGSEELKIIVLGHEDYDVVNSCQLEWWLGSKW